MIRAITVPPDSLLGRHRAAGAYADCYVTELPLEISHAQFVEAFYTTPLFRLERLLLRVLLSRPASDADARQMAEGQRDAFAAWTVESRAENQIVLAAGRTRSWLMVDPGPPGAPARTRLLFGSAVLPRRDRQGRPGRMGIAFALLLGFHRGYSRALLRSARARLVRRLGPDREARGAP